MSATPSEAGSEQSAPRRRGRPPGSTDTRPRTRRPNGVRQQEAATHAGVPAYSDVLADNVSNAPGSDESGAKLERGRAKQRQCSMVPFVGLYGRPPDPNPSSWIMESVIELSSFPKPWWKRPDLFAPSEKVPSCGPYNNVNFLEWALDCNTQAEFAQRFHVPLDVFDPCRQLRSDTENYFFDNVSSRVLFAAVATNPSTTLDRSRVQELSRVTFPQFHGDVWSLDELSGAQGGIAGTDQFVMWNLSVTDDVTCASRKFLDAATGICHALSACRNKAEPNWPGINTKYTSFDMDPRNHNIFGVSFQTKGPERANSAKNERPVHYDVDATLLANIMRHRGIDKEKPMEAITAQHKITSNVVVEDEDIDLPHTNTGELFDCHLCQDVIPGIDSTGKRVFIKFDCLRVKSRVPGMDAAISVWQWLTTATDYTAPEHRAAFYEVMQHMNFLVNGKYDATAETLFTTSACASHFCALTCEANIPLAVAHLAHENGISDVSVGGLRLDYDCVNDRRVYGKYLDFLWTVRVRHFTTVRGHVINDLGILGMSNYARYPIQEFELVGNCQVAYRSVPLSVFKYIWMPRMWKNVNRFVQPAEFRRILTDVLVINANDSDILISDEELEEICSTDEHNVQIPPHNDGDPLVVFATAGPHYNSGIFIRVDVQKIGDSVRMALTRRRTSKAESSAVMGLVQPVRVCAACELFLSVATEAVNPFSVFLTGEDNAPVLDIEAMTFDKRSMTAATIQLQSGMRDVIKSGLQPITSNELMMEDVLRQYGRMPCPAIQKMTDIVQRVDLANMARARHTAFVAAMRQCLDLMSNGELLQYQKAASSYQELKDQGETAGNVFVTQLKFFMDRTSIYGSDREKKNTTADGNNVACFKQFSFKSLNLDIYWGNHLLLEGISNTQIAMFVYQPKFWGATIWVCNHGGATEVLEEEERGSWRFGTTRRAVTVTIKDPSMGADAINQLTCELNLIYPTMISTNAHIRKFYDHEDSKDEISLWNSSMAMAQKWGCGIKKTGRLIDVEDSLYREQMGLGGIITELMKTNASSEKARDAIADLEPLLAESGGGKGMRKNAWSSTHGFQNKSIYSIMPLPLFMICSNRPLKAVPTSTQKGGRMQVWNTTESDGMRGVFEVRRGGRKAAAVKLSDKLSDLQWNDEGRSELKGMDQRSAQGNRLFFLCLHLCRCLVPFLHRCLASSFVEPRHSITTNFRTVLRTASRITLNLRRKYMSDDSTFSRTFNGCFRTATATSQFVKETVFSRMMMAVQLAVEFEGNKIRVPLQEGVSNTMLALHNCTISTHSILSALYIWISQSVLDVNVMIITCYMLYTCNFQQHCPLHVLAKAVKGIPLSRDEEIQYDRLCAYLMPIVYVPTNCIGNNDMANARRRQFKKAECTRLTTETIFHFPNALRSYYEFNKQEYQTNMATEYEKRHTGSWSTYVRSDLNLSDPKPDWDLASEHGEEAGSAQKQEDADHERTFCDKFVNGSNRIRSFHSFASQHSGAAEEKRALLQPVLDNHHIVDFFDAAFTGTKLPRPDAMNGQDSFERPFKNVELTSHWWISVVDNLDGATGPIRLFLTMCGFSLSCSRYDVVAAIFENYKERYPDSFRDVQLCKTPHWCAPILQTFNGQPKVENKAFRLGTAPFLNPKTKSFHGLQPILTVDILWLLVGQGLFTSDWTSMTSNKRRRDNDEMFSSQASTDSQTQEEDTQILSTKFVCHLRNMGSATRVLLEMAMHTMFCKSVIPAQPIMLAFPQSDYCSKSKSQTTVILRYDNRLHTDSHEHATNMLNMHCRNGNNYTLDRNGDSVICHHGAIQATDINHDKTENVHFPFPPESMSHITSQDELIRDVFHKLSVEFPDHTPTVCLAMRIFGASVTPEMVAFYGASLTDAVMQPGFEIPCVTYRNGMAFYLTPIQRGLLLHTFTLTHVSDSTDAVLLQYDFFQTLPLTDGVKVIIPYNLIGYAMSHGLSLGDDGFATFSKKNERDRNVVPFFIMPLVHEFQMVAVKMCYSSLPAIVSGNAETLRLVNVEDVYESSMPFFLDRNSISYKNWMLEYPDIAQWESSETEINVVCFDEAWRDEVRPETSMEYHDLITKRNELTRYWICRRGQKLYCNSPYEALHALRGKNDGIFSQESAWTERGRLLSRSPYETENSVETEKLLILRRDDSNALVAFEISENDFCFDTRYRSFYLRTQLRDAKHCIGQINRSMVTEMDSDKRRALVQDRTQLADRVERVKLMLNECSESLDRHLYNDATIEIIEFECGVGEVPQTRNHAGPPSANTLLKSQNQLAFGFVQRAEGAPSALKDGMYSVLHINFKEGVESDTTHTDFDFISIQRCLIPEGETVYIYITESSLVQLSDVARQDCYILDLDLTFDEDSYFILRAFYVIGMEQACPYAPYGLMTRTLVPLICTDSSGATTFTKNWIFRSSLYDTSACRRVFLSPDEIQAEYGQCQHEIIENIYCTYEKDVDLSRDEDIEVVFFDKDTNGHKTSLLTTTNEEYALDRATADDEDA